MLLQIQVHNVFNVSHKEGWEIVSFDCNVFTSEFITTRSFRILIEKNNQNRNPYKTTKAPSIMDSGISVESVFNSSYVVIIL